MILLLFDTNKLKILNSRPEPLSKESMAVYLSEDENLETFPADILNTSAVEIVASAERNAEFISRINRDISSLKAVEIATDEDDIW